MRNRLEDQFNEKFRKEISNSSRLTLYHSMKDDFKDEQHISDVKYRKYRSTIAKFRISAHIFSNGKVDGSLFLKSGKKLNAIFSFWLHYDTEHKEMSKELFRVYSETRSKSDWTLANIQQILSHPMRSATSANSWS